MTVVFDATMLLLLLRPGVRAPIDPATGRPVEYAEERISQLVSDLEKARVKIVVPAPALSELLVHAGNLGPKLVEQLTRSAAFKLAPFDVLAAVEVAEMTRTAIAAGDKRSGAAGTWAKVKYDRQLVGIAKVCRADILYTDDEDLRKFAESQSVKVIRLAELPLPAERAQAELDLAETLIGNTEFEPIEPNEADG
jgi:predicted nucleic acid-binding protein